MGSVSSSAGVASLLQILSASGSPVVSSPALMSDLENASPEDIIQISISAIQLQGMDTLLGISSGDTSDGSALSSIIGNMTASQTPAEAASTSQSTAGQVASSEASLQAADAQGLFDPELSNTSDLLLDITG